MNTKHNTTGIYAPPTCDVINLELEGAVLENSGTDGSWNDPTSDGDIKLNSLTFDYEKW